VTAVGPFVRLKQFLTGGVGGRETSYRCLTCQATFDRQPQVCPECGGFDVRRSEWIDPAETGTESEETA
jgi:rRNA maturation endonuclease Nob1